MRAKQRPLLINSRMFSRSVQELERLQILQVAGPVTAVFVHDSGALVRRPRKIEAVEVPAVVNKRDFKSTRYST